MATVNAIEIAYSLSVFGIDVEIDEPPTAPAPLNWAKLGIRELRKRCTALGIKGASRWNKARCVAALAVA